MSKKIQERFSELFRQVLEEAVGELSRVEDFEIYQLAQQRVYGLGFGVLKACLILLPSSTPAEKKLKAAVEKEFDDFNTQLKSLVNLHFQRIQAKNRRGGNEG